MTKAVATCGLALLGAWAALAAEPWTLERALRQALADNPDARLAQHRLAAAQAGLDQANAAFWPRLQFQSSYAGSDNPMQAFGSILNQRAYNYGSPPDFNDLPAVDNLNVRGLATVPLYAGGRTTAARHAARAHTDAARQDEAALRNALGFEVTRAFHTVLKTRQFVRAARAAREALENSLAVARRRHDSGTLLKSGVLDLEVRLAQAREDLVRARNAEALATRALRALLGVEPEDPDEFEVADTAPALEAPDAGDFSGRPELAASRHRERAAAEQMREARSGYLPRISAFGSLDYDHGWKFNHGGGSWTAGALLQWDLWDGKLTRAKVREASAQLEAARTEQRKLRLALDLETAQARLDLQAAAERRAVTEHAVAQAQESATLTRARFEQELALPRDLMDAETALITARVRRAEAEADWQIAIGALRKALGLPQLNFETPAK